MTKFWERHEQEMRKQRLLLATATLYSYLSDNSRYEESLQEAAERAVTVALALEKEVTKRVVQNGE